MSLVELLCLPNRKGQFQLCSFISVFINGQVSAPGELVKLLRRMKK